MDSPSRIFLVNIISIFLLQVCAITSLEECHPAKTCGSCMMIDPRCSWCRDTNHTSGSLRCDDEGVLRENGCNDILTEQSTINIIKNEPVQDPVFNNESESDIPQKKAVPISPQVVRLTLRRGDTQTIRVRVRQVASYPVDLYYLMDLSYSMHDDLKSIKDLGSALAARMKEITRSFALGFGTFVDKPVPPYINAIHALKNQPSRKDCVKAYSFRNELSLNRNTSLFNDKVNSTPISANEDSAEGTLDAIMQAVVCEDIGWRNESRRLLLVVSDASFHIEGDGKMAGILRPNDGRCHLEDGSYQTSHLYDYPSLSQINNVLVENNIIPIFAISGKNDQLYTEVANMIQGAIYAKLTGNSSNIEEVIADEYRKITGHIEITYSRREGLDVRIRSNCTTDPNSGYALECEGISDGGEIEFDVDITATKCVNETFEIYPIGFDKRLTIDVSVICNCSCEFSPDVNCSSYCGGFGNAVCGICECLPGHYGGSCQCTGENGENQEMRDMERFCKPDNQTNVFCSGRGECICGECRCHRSAVHGQIISGTYCECNNQACPLEDGEVCGGSERGECVCGLDQRTNVCQCKPGYTGETCSCPTQTDTCRSSNGRICNDQGDCECGRCICHPGTKYSGPRCDECLTCTECDRFISCVKCNSFDVGVRPPGEVCSACASVYEIHNVTELPELENTSSCTLTDMNNCSIRFLHQAEFENGTINIYIPAGKDCPHSDTALIGLEPHLLILYIVLSIILIGLILIFIYRFWTWHLDRKEYQQFLAEKENAQWEKVDNPIYTQSTTKYVNPMYGK